MRPNCTRSISNSLELLLKKFPSIMVHDILKCIIILTGEICTNTWVNFCHLIIWNRVFLVGIVDKMSTILQHFGFVADFLKIVCCFTTFYNLSCLSRMSTLLLLHRHMIIRHCFFYFLVLCSDNCKEF